MSTVEAETVPLNGHWPRDRVTYQALLRAFTHMVDPDFHCLEKYRITVIGTSWDWTLENNVR